MKKKTIGIGVLFLIVLAVFMSLRELPVYKGDRIASGNAFCLSFSDMNTTDTHTLPVEEGDILAVSFHIGRGQADLVIVEDGETLLYRGNRITDGGFELPIAESGDCIITVTAKHAKGSVTVVNTNREPELFQSGTPDGQVGIE